MGRDKYLEYALLAAENIRAKQEALVSGELERVVKTGRLDNNMAFLAYAAIADAACFSVRGDKKYLAYAKKDILSVYDFYEKVNAHYAESKLELKKPFPMLGWMFEPEALIRAYLMIKDGAGFTEDETGKIERIVEESVNPVFKFPEQGAENRCALKATNLLYAAEAFPENKMAPKWRRLAERMMAESVGSWSIEDASTYTCIWVRCLISFNALCPIINEKEDPFLLYYAKFLAAAQLPEGVFADYGDGRWGSDWGVMISVIERAASLFSSGELKYAAEKNFEYMTRLDKAGTFSTWKQILNFVDAYFWADDVVEPVKPEIKSRQVLDDVVGKKIAFARESPDVFMLLNYRDEGCDGVLARDNLRQSLAVWAEKMHHGHADENSVCVLSVDGSVLLHDGGYRDGLESGAFRADFYHNKLLVRNGALRLGQGFFEAAADFGSYVPVETSKLYFYAFDRIDSSRTRIVDRYHRVTSERCVHFLKEENIFVVVDIIKPHEYGEYSFGCAWHNIEIEETDEKKYRMHSPFIGADEYMREIPNKTDIKLTVEFLEKELPCEIVPIYRCYTNEKALCQYFTGICDENTDLCFVSLLVPEREGSPAVYRAEALKNEKGVLTVIEINGKAWHIFDRCRPESVRYDLNRRPSYSFEKGNSGIGGLDTDGLFTAVSERAEDIYFALVTATRVDFKGRSLFSVEPIDHYQLDFVNAPGISSYSNCDDAVLK